ncbi:DNA repair protein RecO [Gemella cuniculi]|uniref:DNA repair protein RecO n=1 Tax=Gemella cuniculi TaxID=150240 RepID=UPI001FE1885D|nr:DNA repair protein RecO [Gemella cuniculi]
MFLTRQSFIKGIIIKKIKYRDYHEILHVLTEHGNIESFFYENVNKSKKKDKVSILYEVSINFFSTSGMNKIINLEIENSYSNIIYDVLKNSYALNIIEYINYTEESNLNLYKLLKYCLNNIEIGVSEKLVSVYFLIQLIKEQGFIFKYQKTNYGYVGYSFIKNSFVDKFNIDSSMYNLEDKLIKVIYYLSIKSIDFLEHLDIENSELLKLFAFLNTLFKEYVGIETKSYKKIIELEEILNSL